MSTSSSLHRLLCALVLVGCVGSAQAAGLTLSWLDCRAPGADGRANQLLGCSSNIVDLPLFTGLHTDTAIDSVIAVELVIDVDVASDPLPPWWHMEPGGCRSGGWVADATPAAGCLDAWAPGGAAAVQGWLPGQPGGSSRHGRLLVAAAAAPGQLATLAADSYYSLARVVLRTNNTLTCEGCSTPACLVFNSVMVRRLPGSTPETLTFSGADVGGSDQVLWQGGAGASCGSVPTRRSTWGAVKALYR